MFGCAKGRQADAGDKVMFCRSRIDDHATVAIDTRRQGVSREPHAVQFPAIGVAHRAVSGAREFTRARICRTAVLFNLKEAGTVDREIKGAAALHEFALLEERMPPQRRGAQTNASARIYVRKRGSGAFETGDIGVG